jgi:DNA polymerase IV
MAPGALATILHADLDAFYASVEQLLDPLLRGRPVAVGGGVVLAASYEARRFGVHGGMSGSRARQLCPHLQFVGGHFGEYQRLGDQVIDVVRDFTPLVERISIDEAFADVAGSTHLFGPPRTIAASIRERVRSEIGLPLSIGVASTKHLAKVASQVAKPDGLVVVEPGTERAFLGPLPVELLWGVGPVTLQRLASTGITTVGELAATDESVLQRLLGGAIGRKLGALATNTDPRRVTRGRRASSVGAQSAFGRRPATPELLRSTLAFLADRIATRMRAGDRTGRTLTVRVRFADLTSVTRSTTLPTPTATTLTLTEHAVQLAEAALRAHGEHQEISLLALSVSKLTEARPLQLELPLGLPDPAEPAREASPQGAARAAVDRAIDQVRERFGRAAVTYAISNRASASTPEEFRQLAERSE